MARRLSSCPASSRPYSRGPFLNQEASRWICVAHDHLLLLQERIFHGALRNPIKVVERAGRPAVAAHLFPNLGPAELPLALDSGRTTGLEEALETHCVRCISHDVRAAPFTRLLARLGDGAALDCPTPSARLLVHVGDCAGLDRLATLAARANAVLRVGSFAGQADAGGTGRRATLPTRW